MIDLKKIKCVGCSACYSACPRGVIEFERNAEGFYYPRIAKPENCVECGLCEKACPVLNFQPEKKFEQRGLIAQITDDEIRKESASGGMFSAIALAVLDDGGVVYGAAYDDDFHVKHVAVADRKDLWKLRNSKYVQSDLKGIFPSVRDNLKAGKIVCFSGTPCQIEGLKCFLNRDYPNLILVDVVCHGVSSPLVWEKYLELMKGYKAKRIYFRWKHYGYKYSTMSLFNERGEESYYEGVETDKMLRAYFSNGCDRDTCYSCLFKKRYRVSDFTIWDCFQPRFYSKGFDDDKGTSCALVHTEKGRQLLDEMIAKGLIRYKDVPADELTYGNNEMVGSVKRNPIRDSFLADAQKMPADELFNKYFPTSFKSKLKRWGRRVLLRGGGYNKLKYLLFIYRRKHKRIK